MGGPDRPPPDGAPTGTDDLAPRRALARAVRARRQQLGLSVRAAARSARVQWNTWSGLETLSRRTAEHNFAGIERALLWQPGSVAAILDGGEARCRTPSPEPAPAQDRNAPMIDVVVASDLTDAEKVAWIARLRGRGPAAAAGVTWRVLRLDIGQVRLLGHVDFVTDAQRMAEKDRGCEVDWWRLTPWLLAAATSAGAYLLVNVPGSADPPPGGVTGNDHRP